SRMVHLLQDLVADHGLSPDRLTAVVTGTAEGADLSQRLVDLGLSAPSIITEHELATGARRLIMQLSTRQAVAGAA
ncbi:MAG: hypothetical protein BRD30_13155, partial [Bacteroidetes bacterium QH_2_63_10]